MILLKIDVKLNKRALVDTLGTILSSNIQLYPHCSFLMFTIFTYTKKNLLEPVNEEHISNISLDSCMLPDLGAISFFKVYFRVIASILLLDSNTLSTVQVM